MITKRLHQIITITLTILLVQYVSQTIAIETRINDIYGNLLSNNDAKFTPSSCCILPTCTRPGHCYQMQSCGYLCSTGRYPPVEYGTTPGYRLKTSYSEYDCKFGDCKTFEYLCEHCQNPGEPNFSIYTVREDCKKCYERGF